MAGRICGGASASSSVWTCGFGDWSCWAQGCQGKKEYFLAPLFVLTFKVLTCCCKDFYLTNPQASKEFIAHNIERGKHRLFVRYFPDYPISLRPSNTRMGGGKNKVAEYKDYVMAGL